MAEGESQGIWAVKHCVGIGFFVVDFVVCDGAKKRKNGRAFARPFDGLLSAVIHDEHVH